MENFPASSYESNNAEQPAPMQDASVYPPKYEKKEQAVNIWLRSASSLALYLVLGFFVFPSFNILLIITAIVVLHEMGHFAAMKYFHYKDLGIFFIPLLGAYVSGVKREVSERQSAVILLAGPLPGIVLGIVLYLVEQNGPGYYFMTISLTNIATLCVILNMINLLPIYPLDGGQLLNRVFLDEESWLGKIFVFISAAFMCWLAWELHFWILLIFPAIMLMRLQSDKKFDSVEKAVESEGINLDVSYEEMPDADYWRIRTKLIEQHPSFHGIEPGPPYEYDQKEEKIMTTIQSLLHRHLIQDVSIAGKLFIFLIWVAAFVAPWLINKDELLIFFHRFGF